MIVYWSIGAIGVVAVVLAVLGVRSRRAAVAAVLAVLAALIVAAPATAVAVLAGAACAAYLSAVFARTGPAGVDPFPAPAVLGAAGFGAAAVLADLAAPALAWTPVLAPIVVLVLYVAVLRPLGRG